MLPPNSDLPAGLAQPAQRALAHAGIRRLEDLAQVNAADIAKLHGIGPNALSKLRATLRGRGLSFADER